MLEEAIVFSGQNGLLHHGGHIFDAHHAAPFFAEFANQHTIFGPDAQRHLRPVIGQDLHRGQPLGTQHGSQDKRQCGNGRQRERNPDEQRKQPDATLAGAGSDLLQRRSRAKKRGARLQRGHGG